jgi:hypothetical protein
MPKGTEMTMPVDACPMVYVFHDDTSALLLIKNLWSTGRWNVIGNQTQTMAADGSNLAVHPALNHLKNMLRI